ncbi:MAG: peptide deformylase [Myxococcota bacterium]
MEHDNAWWAAANPTGYTVVQLGHSALRTRAEPVPEEAFGTVELASFLQNMVHTLRTQQGVGLAAPQVGVTRRIFLTHLPEGLERRYMRCTPDPLRVWINPSWEALEESPLGGMEGCLSIPHYIGRVLRPSRIRVQGQDHHGKPQTATLDGWNARVFLHEWDHLEGTLYLDRLAPSSKGHPELYHKSSWEQTEHAHRAAGDHVWLRERSLLPWDDVVETDEA